MRRHVVLGLQSITGRWRNRGLAWKTGFLVGVILGGATMMAAHVGVPLRLQAGDGGSHSMVSSFQTRLDNPSKYSAHGQIGMANHPLAGSPANTSTETAVTGLEVALIDGSNCQDLPPEMVNSHSLPLRQGVYLIYLPAHQINEKGTPAKPKITIEVVRDAIGYNTEPIYGANRKSTNISVNRRTAW